MLSEVGQPIVPPECVHKKKMVVKQLLKILKMLSFRKVGEDVFREVLTGTFLDLYLYSRSLFATYLGLYLI